MNVLDVDTRMVGWAHHVKKVERLQIQCWKYNVNVKEKMHNNNSL